MRRVLLPLVGALALPGVLAAQASQFGDRGLGQPGREMSVRALGTSGALATFDEGSSLNPASIAGLQVFTASFTTLADFRSSTNAAGSANERVTRFPQVMIAGPIPRSRFAIGLSASTYLNRDFGLATQDTLLLRGVPVPVFDTTVSKGSITDVRLALAYRTGGRGALGIAFHVLNGSTRNQLHRIFADSNYAPAVQAAELSYSGVGVSVGIAQALSSALAVSASARWDSKMTTDRDSTRVLSVAMPLTFTGAIRGRPTSRLDLGLQGIFRTWDRANDALVTAGAPGAANTYEVSFGGEYTADKNRPFRRPIRFGARYATLPFYVVTGAQPKEYGASIGTGTRFAANRAGIDLSLEHLWRSDGTGRKETAWLIGLGVSVRP